MFNVYLIYFITLDQLYIGQTENLNDQVFRHSNWGSKSTKKANDWVLKYHESFETRSEAIKRENQIKKMKSRKYIDTLISSAG